MPTPEPFANLFGANTGAGGALFTRADTAMGAALYAMRTFSIHAAGVVSAGDTRPA